MQALLLATGETQKLKPLTGQIPSPMITVMNRPVMLYNLELLGRLGFKRILVSVHNKADKIEQYFGNGQKWGLSLEYLILREALGTAGILRRASYFLKETFLVMPADVIADLEIAWAIHNHIDQQAQATVIVQPGSLGAERTLITDAEGRLLAIGNDHATSVETWTNTGIYLFDPNVFDQIPFHQPSDIHNDLLPLLLAEGVPVHICPLPGYWNPLDTLQQYAEAQHMFLSKALRGEAQAEEKITYRYHFLDTHPIDHGIWIGRNSKVHPNVKIIPPVSIGHSTWIEREVELGPGVVVGSNVVIDRGATIQNSTILDNTYIGKLVNVENRLIDQDQLIDPCTNDTVRVKSPTLLGKINPQFITLSFKRLLDCFLAFLIVLGSLPLTLTLAVLLLFSTGHIFAKVPCRSPRSFRWEEPAAEADTFNLLHFNTCLADGSLAPIGRWMKLWEGERLPELWNVLKGDLAMVGLQPVLTEMQSNSAAAWQMEQGQAPAGFTGLWYVQSGADSSPEEMQIADAYYLATRSFNMDWRILLSTPAAWYRRVRKEF